MTSFLNYLRFERHFSPHTAKCYAGRPAPVLPFLGEHGGAVPDPREQRLPPIHRRGKRFRRRDRGPAADQTAGRGFADRPSRPRTFSGSWPS